MDAKELLEKIKEEFRKRFKEKESFSDYKQVQSYAVEIADKSSKAVINNFDDSLINEFGTLNYDILNEVLSDILESDYKLIANACVIAQTEMNKNANIGLKAIAPKYDDDRAHSIIWDMAQRDLNSFKQAYPAYTDNFYQSTVDEAVRANADFQWKARLEPKIVRIAEPTACKWCKSIEGTYKYEDVKDTGNDVFRRHTDCKCTVTYVPMKGKAREAWSKRYISDEELNVRIDKAVSYRQLHTSKDEESIVRQGYGEYRVKKVLNSTYEVYVSVNARLDHQGFKNIEKNIKKALKQLKLQENYELPKFYILSSKEMGKGRMGAYAYKTNSVFLPDIYGSIPKTIEAQRIYANPEDPSSTVLHELIHWLNTMRYIEKYGHNFDDYEQYLNDVAYEQLTKYDVNVINVSRISYYAFVSLLNNKFDEVLTEFKVSKKGKI
ncbi:MAG TPA: hypothetical protein PLT36_01515 [Erysipelotrichaceae bacterium]|nr:hypothetical protein [Erysipelotrichaceae bacterium]